MRFTLENQPSFEALKRHLSTGLRRLRFVDNFQSFQVAVEILNGEEISIRNRLQEVPEKRIIVRQSGNGLVTDGDTTWTKELVYLKNHGPDDVTVTVIFLR